MPTQQRPRRHQQHAPRRARQMAGCRCQQRSVRRGKLRPRDLPTQDLKLVAQYQQLDILHMQAAAATNKRAEQSTHRQVEKRERPCRRSSQPWPRGDATQILGALHSREPADWRARQSRQRVNSRPRCSQRPPESPSGVAFARPDGGSSATPQWPCSGSHRHTRTTPCPLGARGARAARFAGGDAAVARADGSRTPYRTTFRLKSTYCVIALTLGFPREPRFVNRGSRPAALAASIGGCVRPTNQAVKPLAPSHRRVGGDRQPA